MRFRRQLVRWGGGPPLITGAPVDGAIAAAPAPAPAAGVPPDAPDAASALSVSIRATSCWTGTVCPSVTRISTSTPADGAGISASTLSVEISKIGSSRFTSSPTFFNHFDSVPSAIDSPIWGMMTSTRATAIASHSEFLCAVRAFRIRQMTNVGTTIMPSRAPRSQ